MLIKECYMQYIFFRFYFLYYIFSSEDTHLMVTLYISVSISVSYIIHQQWSVPPPPSPPPRASIQCLPRRTRTWWWLSTSQSPSQFLASYISLFEVTTSSCSIKFITLHVHDFYVRLRDYQRRLAEFFKWFIARQM